MSLAVICDSCGKAGPPTNFLDVLEAYKNVQDWYLAGDDFCPDCKEIGIEREEDVWQNSR